MQRNYKVLNDSEISLYIIHLYIDFSIKQGVEYNFSMTKKAKTAIRYYQTVMEFKPIY